MNALLEELLEKEETTELELCILWVADDAEKWEEGDMPYEHAAKAAAELAALRARVAELEGRLKYIKTNINDGVAVRFALEASAEEIADIDWSDE